MNYVKYFVKILSQEEILSNVNLMIGIDILIGKRMDKNLSLQRYFITLYLKMMVGRMAMVWENTESKARIIM